MEGNQTMPQKKYFTPEEKMKAKTDAQWRYDQNNTTRVFIKLNNGTDADILKYLQTISNKQGYVKDLIRTDMKSKGFETKEDSQQ